MLNVGILGEGAVVLNSLDAVLWSDCSPCSLEGGKKRVNGGKRRRGFLRLDMKSHMYDRFN